MRCPVCNMEMRLTDRQGIEIDYCPQCRGLWLDRGELDKIIERSAQFTTDGDHVELGSYDRYAGLKKKKKRGHFDDDDDDNRAKKNHKYYDRREKKKKKENPITDFLGDLFDF